MSYGPETWEELRRRDAEATARTIIDTLANQDVEPPLTPEQELESWKFACAGWRERAEALEEAVKDALVSFPDTNWAEHYHPFLYRAALSSGDATRPTGDK